MFVDPMSLPLSLALIGVGLWQPAAVASLAPPSAVSTAAPANPASQPSAPPSAPISACDATPWPAMPGVPQVQPVRVESDATGCDEGATGAFQLLRVGAAGTAPVVGDSACLWINPPGGYTLQMGLSSPDERTGTAPTRPPQAHRFHRLRVEPCAEDVSLSACVRLACVPPLADTPGNVPALLRLPGQAEPLPLALHRTPNWGGLLGCMLLGLLGSFLVTLWAPKLAGLRDRRRRLRQLEPRRAASEEDFVPLLNRVDALMELCRQRLQGWRANFGVLFFDEVLLDDRLREAEQLLELSELKTRCWHASQGHDVPPTVETQIADLLRRFDAEVFQAPLPVVVDAANPERWHPPALVEARRLMGKIDAGFHRNLAAAVQDAVSAPLPAPLPGDAEPERRSLWDRVEAVRAAEILALTPHGHGRSADFEALAPRLLRALDARVNVWRAVVQVQARLASAARLPERGLRERLEEGLAEWSRQDLLAPMRGRPDLPALRGLLWRASNARDIADLTQALTLGRAPDLTPPTPGTVPEAPPRLRVEAPQRWRTFEPVTIELVLDHRLNRSYVWRQNLRVYWTVEGLGRDDEGELRFAERRMGDADVFGDLKLGERTWRVFMAGSARVTVYASRALKHIKLRPVAVALRDPIEGVWGDPLPLQGAPCVEVAVNRNPDASTFAGVGAGHIIRFACTGALSLTTGLVFVDGLFANAQGWAVYAQAFAWAFSIDLATVALRGGWKLLQDRLPSLSRSPT
jgi:hypothetical protein